MERIGLFILLVLVLYAGFIAQKSKVSFVQSFVFTPIDNLFFFTLGALIRTVKKYKVEIAVTILLLIIALYGKYFGIGFVETAWVMLGFLAGGFFSYLVGRWAKA